MTFKDKLRAMNPEGGEAGVEEAIARLCPADLGFESETPKSCPNMCLKVGTFEDCMKCWEREATPQPATPAAPLKRGAYKEGDLK